MKYLFALFVMFIMACAQAPPEPTAVVGQEEVSTGSDVIKIGWMGPLSGEAASYGESIKRGVELAKKEMNVDVEIIFEDTKCDVDEAASAAQKLINVDQVVAIIGEVCSSATLAAHPHQIHHV